MARFYTRLDFLNGDIMSILARIPNNSSFYLAMFYPQRQDPFCKLDFFFHSMLGSWVYAPTHSCFI